MQIEKIHPNY